MSTAGRFEGQRGEGEVSIHGDKGSVFMEHQGSAPGGDRDEHR